MTLPGKQGLSERGGLNAEDISDIQHLAERCNQYEGLDLKLNWDILKHRSSEQTNDFLYYMDGQLVGFLALFSFNGREGEISGMVHPAYRRRGIFKSLFEAALPECRRRKLSTLLLIVEQQSAAGQAFVRQITTVRDHSEYKMVWQETALPAPAHGREMQFRVARPEDAQALAHITALAFHIPEEEVTWYNNTQALTTRERGYYVGEIDGQIIGKVDVSFSDDAGVILGLAVLEEERGRGYGRQILTQTIQEILKYGRRNIWLEVLTENRQALSLYQSCGFQETGGYDYYGLALEADEDPA